MERQAPTSEEIAHVGQLVAELLAWLREQGAARVDGHAQLPPRPLARMTSEQLAEAYRLAKLKRPKP